MILDVKREIQNAIIEALKAYRFALDEKDVCAHAVRALCSAVMSHLPDVEKIVYQDIARWAPRKQSKARKMHKRRLWEGASQFIGRYRNALELQDVTINGGPIPCSFDMVNPDAIAVAIHDLKKSLRDAKTRFAFPYPITA